MQYYVIPVAAVDSIGDYHLVGGSFSDFQTIVTSIGAIKNVYAQLNQYTGFVDGVIVTFTSDFHSAVYNNNAQYVVLGVVPALTLATVQTAYPHAITAYLSTVSNAA